MKPTLNLYWPQALMVTPAKPNVLIGRLNIDGFVIN